MWRQYIGEKQNKTKTPLYSVHACAANVLVFFSFQYGHTEIARDCLKMYFMKQQPSNQFLIRAYLCQAQLLAPQNANNPVYCSVCVCEL